MKYRSIVLKASIIYLGIVAGCAKSNPADPVSINATILSIDGSGYEIQYVISNSGNNSLLVESRLEGCWYSYRIRGQSNEAVWPPPGGVLPTEPLIVELEPGRSITAAVFWDGTTYPDFAPIDGEYTVVFSNVFSPDKETLIDITWPPPANADG